MRPVGLHTSIAGGLHLALERGHALGCTTVQIFSHNPRGWAVSALSGEEVEAFRSARMRTGINPVYIHCSYLLNIASPKEDLRVKSAHALRAEMERADLIGADYVVLHSGTAHDGLGLKRAQQSIREAIAGSDEFRAGLLIENTSGKRGDITSRVADMAALLDGTGGRAAGVCIDSCHAFAAGYDLTTAEGLHALASEVERLLGGGAVRLIHLNDSKGDHATGTDRHEHIGQGRIGMHGLGALLAHPVFASVPVVLETPRETDADDLGNLARARSLM
jgi:deoxyribonuclease-4